MNFERLREIRELRGLSKRRLAILSGIGEMQLGRYELGLNDPSTENLKKLADILQVSTDYLLDVTDDPQGHFGDDKAFSDAELEIITTFRREGWAGVLKMGVHEITNK